MYVVQDICNRYLVTTNTVLGWIRSGQLKAINVGRTPGARKPRWRISDEALQAFEQARTPTQVLPRTRHRRESEVIEFY